MRPHLTNRGRLVVAIALSGAAFGRLFGNRTVDAIVVTAVLLLVTTGLYVWRFEVPTVRRSMPQSGHQGATVAVSLWVPSARSYPAHVTERSDNGLSDDADHRVVTDGRRLEHSVTLENRGHRRVGPVRVRGFDPFGLWSRTFTAGGRDTITVYPRVEPVSAMGFVHPAFAAFEDRGHFDGVREYQPGDPLRDIHWKSTAKRPGELLVAEYAGDRSEGGVMLAVESRGSTTDRVATAAASVSVALLDGGLAVGLETPDGTVESAFGGPQRRRLLEHLAGFTGGSIREKNKDEADILIHSPRDEDRVYIQIGDERVAYQADGTTNAPAGIGA